MAKRHDKNDFDPSAFETNHELEALLFGNEHGSKADGQQELLPKRAFHRAGHRLPAIAKGNSLGKQAPSKAILKQLRKLETHRSQMSKQEYQKARTSLLRGMLTLGQSSNSRASPAAKGLREKLAKAFGADRER